MALPPITLQLSTFENIEILRQEIETRKEELKETEKRIRTILWEVERQRFLKSLHPLFQQLQEPPDAAQLQQLQAYREALNEALVVMKQTLSALESKAQGQSAEAQAGRPRATPAGGPASSASSRRARFESFESFRDKKGGAKA